jgi:hypothetical protein
LATIATLVVDEVRLLIEFKGIGQLADYSARTCYCGRGASAIESKWL